MTSVHTAYGVKSKWKKSDGGSNRSFLSVFETEKFSSKDKGRLHCLHCDTL